MNARKNNAGFSLMEVLVALVIFSLIALAGMRYVGDQTVQIAHLTDKTLASIIASNTLTEIRAKPLPDKGNSYKQVSMAERSWQITVFVGATDTPSLRRVTVSVSRAVEGKNETSEALATLVGFAGKY